MILSVLTFDFNLVLGSFLTFWALICYFWGQGLIQTLILGLLIFYDFLDSYFSVWLNFEIIFLLFGALMGSFWGQGRVPKRFLGLIL